MAAQQAASLIKDRKVYVIPAKTIPQGIMAAMNFDESQPVKKIISLMTEAVGNVFTGQITTAARDSEFDGEKIKKGQILALREDKLAFSCEDETEAVLRLMKDISNGEPGFIYIFSGADVSAEKAEELSARVTEEYPNTDITLVPGGQPVYHYILSVEC